jgi:hypothetical protein
MRACVEPGGGSAQQWFHIGESALSMRGVRQKAVASRSFRPSVICTAKKGLAREAGQATVAGKDSDD